MRRRLIYLVAVAAMVLVAVREPARRPERRPAAAPDKAPALPKKAVTLTVIDVSGNLISTRS